MGLSEKVPLPLKVQVVFCEKLQVSVKSLLHKFS